MPARVHTPESKRLDRLLSEITAVDVQGYEEAKRIRERLAFQECKHKAADFAPATKAGAALKRHIRKALHPHRVEFLRDTPGYTIFWAPPRCVFHVSVEIWPDKQPRSIGFRSYARSTIRDSFGARDAAELAHILAGLKAAADALAEMLFTPSGDRAALANLPTEEAR